MADAHTPARSTVPTPGSSDMPPWELGELEEPPKRQSGAWRLMLGPAVIAAGAAIGGGEWLMGPKVTAQYGGAVMWIAMSSLLAQVIFNLEASRYTLYSGEPILLGVFRTLPGPYFWFLLYVLMDVSSVFPYLAANAATPALALWLGKLPNPDVFPEHKDMLRYTSYGILALSVVPLLFGGKIYNALKVMMTIKVFVVLGFLTFMAIFYSSFKTWSTIGTGLISFGTIPVEGGGLKNIFVSLYNGEGMPPIARSSLKDLSAFAAIAGVGGMAQTAISNYTRDQGWGMGKHVGAIPSMIGGQNIKLSHTGMVFTPTPTALERWTRWYQLVVRDQVGIWLPACIIGVALPAMLSLEFLPRDVVVSDWTAAGMTADGVNNRVGGTLGTFYWYAILFCGFLVLVPSTSSAADGFVRRWVDASWTALPQLRKMESHQVRYVYFAFLIVFFANGVFLLSTAKPITLLLIAGTLQNFALGICCVHTLYVNCSLLPPALRPGWGMRIALFMAGFYYLGLASLTTLLNPPW